MTIIVEWPLALRLKLAAIYFVMCNGGIFLMLLVMTFNAGILLSIVTGQAIAYALTDIGQKIAEDLHSVKALNLYQPTSDACCQHAEHC